MKHIEIGKNGEKPRFIGISYGSFAMDILCLNGSAQVLGVTSKGIFLQNERGQIVFISGERFCGPLTINLSKMIDFKKIFTVGQTCLLAERLLQFPHCTVSMSDSALLWRPTKIKFLEVNLVEIKERGIQFMQNLIAAHQNGPFLPFLTAVARLPLVPYAVDPEQSLRLMNLLPGQHVDSENEFSNRVSGLIGYGPGLTPSGDDFICGFALAGHYLGWCDKLDMVRRGLIEKLVENSKTYTTSLAAQLIRCAASGSADERLMNCLQWIAQGGESSLSIKEELLSYGSSSGVDTFAGMLAALVLHWSG